MDFLWSYSIPTCYRPVFFLADFSHILFLACNFQKGILFFNFSFLARRRRRKTVYFCPEVNFSLFWDWFEWFFQFDFRKFRISYILFFVFSGSDILFSIWRRLFWNPQLQWKNGIDLYKGIYRRIRVLQSFWKLHKSKLLSQENRFWW